MLLAAGTSQFGLAWVALCSAFALHVVDEALTDFLSVYNPRVRAIRARLPWLPLPTFTFRVWLGGLIVAVLTLGALSPFAWAPAEWIRPLARVFGVVMLGNGLLHLGAAAYRRRAVPGVASAPLLVAGAIYLWAAIP
ncbi:MAG TPA: HXXEE domain-containing protein [Gemmatimonadales bacterium]|nr:HXXEE domain-containing protein [Gemmatimonadales bacterium]